MTIGDILEPWDLIKDIELEYFLSNFFNNIILYPYIALFGFTSILSWSMGNNNVNKNFIPGWFIFSFIGVIITIAMQLIHVYMLYATEDNTLYTWWYVFHISMLISLSYAYLPLYWACITRDDAEESGMAIYIIDQLEPLVWRFILLFIFLSIVKITHDFLH